MAHSSAQDSNLGDLLRMVVSQETRLEDSHEADTLSINEPVLAHPLKSLKQDVQQPSHA